MTFDASEFHAQAKEKADPVKDMRGLLEMADRAAVRAEHLTGDEHWDHFLSYIQATINELDEHIAATRNDLASPRLANTEQIMLLKMQAAGLESRRDALQAVIELPGLLIRNGDLARSRLKELIPNKVDKNPSA